MLCMSNKKWQMGQIYVVSSNYLNFTTQQCSSGVHRAYSASIDTQSLICPTDGSTNTLDHFLINDLLCLSNPVFYLISTKYKNFYIQKQDRAKWPSRLRLQIILSHVRDGRQFEPGCCQNSLSITIQRVSVWKLVIFKKLQHSPLITVSYNRILRVK